MKETESITSLNEGGSRVFFKRPLSFVFISAYLVDANGNIKWSKDGYLKGDSPFIKPGETKQFSLISLISSPLEKGDNFYIAAYIKRSLLVIINPSEPESPDGDINIFAFYQSNF